MKEKYTLEDLAEIIRTLRAEGRCPWDREQTHETLREAMLEEAYEAADAIDKGDMANLCEETGDVLLQVVFHAQIEAEKGGYTLDDVLKGVCEKMIYRHPHVFSTGVTAETPEEVLVNWEALKKKEKHLSGTSLMRFPPFCVQKKCRKRRQMWVLISTKAAARWKRFSRNAGSLRRLSACETVRKRKNLAICSLRW